jgi:hypothetical protein
LRVLATSPRLPEKERPISTSRTRFRAACRLACSLAGVWALGCGGQASYAGLANVPNPNRPWSADDLGRDSVANGTESCNGAARPADDPLRSRIPPCPEQPGRTTIKPRGAKPPPANVTNVSAPAE